MVVGCAYGLRAAAGRGVSVYFSGVAHSERFRNAGKRVVVNVSVLSRRRRQLCIGEGIGSVGAWRNGRRRSGPLCAASVPAGSSQGPPQPPAESEVRSDAGSSEEPQASSSSPSVFQFASSMASAVDADAMSPEQMPAKKRRNRKGERTVYLLAAIASTVGFTTLAAGAVYYRFVWQMQGGPEVPYAEMLGTFLLAIGAAVGMEFWARWAHRALWHASLWNMHESHHKAREGPFELNDIFAIINAVPAIALMAFGFFFKGFVPGLCFGAGLGITMFGMSYMFVHDGLVHRRFPVGPIADVPYLQKVAAAHKLHHADLFGGVPYGLFLGPKELELVGGEEELNKVLTATIKNRESERRG